MRDHVTTLCRAWAVTRHDGEVLGFTDHDEGFGFEGIAFRADSGMSARQLVQTTGLSVDNTEAMGALSSEAITEADIAAGRYDGAVVRAWEVDWRDPERRRLTFRGTLGEIRREGGAFHAELRGLAEALNQPIGRVYQKGCDAVLGDGRCGVDLEGYAFEAEVSAVEGRRITVAGLPEREAEWFARGRLEVLSGAAAGLEGVVKFDRAKGEVRVLELWAPLGAALTPGDALRVTAGCDRREATCRAKFGNFANFRGFPHIPDTDWLVRVPAHEEQPDGGSPRPFWYRGER